MTGGDEWQSREESLDNRTLVRRLLSLAWQFRLRCIQILVLQLILLAMGLGGLGLTGVGIDYLRFSLAHDIEATRNHFARFVVTKLLVELRAADDIREDDR